MVTNYATEGCTGANFARVTELPEFQTGVRQRGTNSRDYIYVRASGAIAAEASCKVTQAGGEWRAVSGPGQHVADVDFADGHHGWVRQRFSLPDEAAEVDFDDTFTGWGVANLQAAIEHINDTFSVTYHTHALNDLSDVSVTGPSVNEVLSWSGSQWVATAPVSTLGSLSDVTLVSESANDTIVWNGSAWVNEPENAHTHTLSDITDAGTLASLDSINNGNWSGTDLAVGNGGTGAGDATSARTNLGLAIGSDVQGHDDVLDSLSGNSDTSGALEKTGADTVGTYPVTTAGKALMGDASAAAQRTTLGLGALAVENTVGTALLDNNSVTNVELADMAEAAIKGRQAGSGTGNPQDLTAAQARAAMGLGALAVLDTAGASDIDAGAVDTSKIADDAVTLDKLAHGSHGDILYYAASGVPARLLPGTSGQLLQTNGSASNPSWATVGALTDGDKGDIAVSSSGTVWTIDGKPTGTIVGTSDTQTLTNKTMAFGSNTVSMTKAQLSSAVTDDNPGYVGTSNTWTAAQTFSAASNVFQRSGSQCVTYFKRTDTHGDDAYAAVWVMQGRDSASAASDFVQMNGYCILDNAGAEDVRWELNTKRSGTLAQRMFVGAGVYHPSVSGGDKGNNTINFGAVYDDNSLLTCYPFDAYLDGDISAEKWDARVPDTPNGDGTFKARRHEDMRKFKARLGTDTDPLNLDKYIAHWKTKRHLTALPNEANFDVERGLPAGAWIQRLVETVEIQAIHISQLHERLKAVEVRARSDPSEPFDGAGSVHSTSHVAPRDVVHQASGVTQSMG